MVFLASALFLSLCLLSELCLSVHILPFCNTSAASVSEATFFTADDAISLQAFVEWTPEKYRITLRHCRKPWCYIGATRTVAASSTVASMATMLSVELAALNLTDVIVSVPHVYDSHRYEMASELRHYLKNIRQIQMGTDVKIAGFAKVLSTTNSESATLLSRYEPRVVLHGSNADVTIAVVGRPSDEVYSVEVLCHETIEKGDDLRLRRTILKVVRSCKTRPEYGIISGSNVSIEAILATSGPLGLKFTQYKRPDEVMVSAAFHSLAFPWADLDENQIVYLCSIVALTIGFENDKGAFIPVFHRNTMFPSFKVVKLRSKQCGCFFLRVFEGESATAARNHWLSDLRLSSNPVRGQCSEDTTVLWHMSEFGNLMVEVGAFQMQIEDSYSCNNNRSMEDIEKLIMDAERVREEDEKIAST